MKVAFTGKGGVGKTTLASLFTLALSKEGGEILAIDCDPDTNLARTLGFKGAESITPIVQMKTMIDERMGVSGAEKSFFKLNPKIDDIPDRFSESRGNIKLIVMGAVEKGGRGCMCPENTFAKTLLSHLMLRSGEHLVMDMEAGLEHLGRGTAASCDFVLVVVEPSLNSLGTAERISRIAGDIGIRKVYAVGNKVRSADDINFIKKELGEIRLIDTIGFDEAFLSSGKEGGISGVSDETNRRVDKIRGFLEEDIKA